MVGALYLECFPAVEVTVEFKPEIIFLTGQR